MREKVSPPTLLSMTEDLMGKIMENTDFKSIMILRKVCWTLRNYIDDKKPDVKLNQIFLAVDHDSVYVVYNDNIKIQYQSLKKLTANGDEHKKILKNAIFLDLFLKDFKLVLEHQKSTIEYFTICSSANHVEKINAFFNKFQKLLESLNKKLKVSMITLHTNNQKLMSVLPFLEPKTLECIQIQSLEGKIDEVIELGQWKYAKYLFLPNYSANIPIEKFIHFSTVEMGTESFGLAEVKFIKEAFCKTTKIESFNIRFNEFKCYYGQILDYLGRGIQHEAENKKIWFFRTSEDDKVLLVSLKDEGNSYEFRFSRNTPTESALAFIQD